MWWRVLLGKNHTPVSSCNVITTTSILLLIIILTPYYNLSGLFSAGNLPAVSAFTTNDSNNDNNISYTKLNQTSTFTTLNGSTLNNNNNKSSSSPILLNYDNPLLGIRIQYPSNWLVAAHFIGGVFIIQFVSPRENSTDQFADNINIAIQNVLPRTTIAQYAKAIDNMLIARHLNVTESQSNINNSALTLAGMPAFERLFNVSQHVLDKNLKILPLDLKIMQLYTIMGDKGYIVTYTAQASRFSSHLQLVQKMIDSFKIIPAGQTSNLGAANAGSNNTNHTAATFHSTFDTYILPGSARGYGVYSKPISNQSFLQGDTAELYVELIGFGYRAVTTNQNTTASNGNTTTTATPQGQTDFTANILLFDKQGKELLATQYKVPHMVVPLGQHQYITIPIQIPKNLPGGQYDVRYFIMDGTSGNNFEMDKHIIIMAPKLQASVS
jgi:hypothetical protein